MSRSREDTCSDKTWKDLNLLPRTDPWTPEFRESLVICWRDDSEQSQSAKTGIYQCFLFFSFFFLVFCFVLACLRFYLASKSLPKHQFNMQTGQWKTGQKNLTDISPKKTYRWLISTWKDAQHHSFLEKCKSISHLSEWPSSKTLQTINIRGCEQKGTLLQCWWECKLAQTLWRTVWRFLKNLGIKLSYDPTIPLLGIHP